MRKRIRKTVGRKTKFRSNITVLGIDPDVNHCGVCMIIDGVPVEAQVVCPQKPAPVWVGEDKRVGMAAALACQMDYLIQEFKPDLVVIEWQNIRPNDPRPNDILELATIAGMCVSLAAREQIEILRPLPVQWKGSVAKKIHQPKILQCAAQHTDDPSYVADDLFSGISKSLRNHAIDALGLAIWGAQ